MHGFMLLGAFDWIQDFFKSMLDFIPKLLYLLYASLAGLLDIFQLVMRKLAGLDVYYDPSGDPVSGDIVTNFIAGILGIKFDGYTASFDYSVLSTVFWSFVLFGVIITFVAVFVAIIKSHYNYDEQSKAGPMQQVYAGLKALLNIAVVPIIVVLGLYVSQAVLTAVDSITAGATAAGLSDFNQADLESVQTSRGLATNSQNKDEKTYIFYDILGFGSHIIYGKDENKIDWKGWTGELALVGSSTQTFSGVLFRAAAYNANRARIGDIDVSKPGIENIYGMESGGVFSNPKPSATRDEQQALADMIDTAFACNLHLSDAYMEDAPAVKYVGKTDANNAARWTSATFFANFFTRHISAFSKFNIGAVWYYYDLWQFNFIIGFGALVVCVSLFINIVLGLMTRIFMCIGLFLIAPPLFGLAPLDKGNAAKGWRENFMKQVLMAYGSILGMNIFFLIFPVINQIKFTNINIVDILMSTLIIIVGLISIKAFISLVSGLVGGADANETGSKIKDEVGETVGKAVSKTGKAIEFAGNVGQSAYKGLNAAYNAIQGKREDTIAKNAERSAAEDKAKNAGKNKLMEQAFNGLRDGSLDEAGFQALAKSQGLTDAQASAMWNAAANGDSLEEAKTEYGKSDFFYRTNEAGYKISSSIAAKARERQQEHIKKREESLKLAKTNLRAAAQGAGMQFAGLVKGDSAVSKALDKIKHKDTPEERTAKAAEAQLEQQEKFKEALFGADKTDEKTGKKYHQTGALETVISNLEKSNEGIELMSAPQRQAKARQETIARKAQEKKAAEAAAKSKANVEDARARQALKTLNLKLDDATRRLNSVKADAKIKYDEIERQFAEPENIDIPELAQREESLKNQKYELNDHVEKYQKTVDELQAEIDKLQKKLKK